MSKKFIASIIAIALALLGLGQSSPATAAPIASDIIDLPAGAQIITLIPIDDEKTLAIWRNDDGIQSSQFHANGTFDHTAMITPYVSGHYAGFADNNYWVKLSDGTIALTWTTQWYSGQTTYSDISVAFTDDAVEWSNPLSPAPTMTTALNACYMFFECGYSGSQIATNSLGSLAVQYESGEDGSHKSLVTQISADGATWSAPTKLAENYSYSFARAIVGLDNGGFISSWSLSNGHRYFSRTNGMRLSTWTRAAEIADDSNQSSAPNFVKTGPTDYTLFYLTRTDGVMYVKSRTFSSVTKTWTSPRVIIEISANGWDLGGIQVSEPRNGKVAVSLGFALDGQLQSGLYMNLVGKSEVGTQSVVTTLASQSTYFSPVALNNDNSITVVTAPLNGVVTIETYLNGVATDTHVIPYPDAQTVGLATSVSASGNVYVVAQRSPARGFTYQRATLPIPTGTPKVNGKAKLGAKLAAAAVSFGGFSGAGTTTYQWYSCTRAVAANTVALPVGCSPIAKATLPTFKLTGKQKGKFVTVALKNANAYGATTLFAPVATKTK